MSWPFGGFGSLSPSYHENSDANVVRISCGTVHAARHACQGVPHVKLTSALDFMQTTAVVSAKN